MEPPAGYQEIAGMRLGYLRVGGRQLFALAQVLSGPLRGVPRGRVCRRMERLQIQSRRCDLRELRALKALRSVPSRAVQCRLISREDLLVLCSSSWGPNIVIAKDWKQTDQHPPDTPQKDCTTSRIRAAFPSDLSMFQGPPHSPATSAGYSSPSDCMLDQTSSSDTESDSSASSDSSVLYRSVDVNKRSRPIITRSRDCAELEQVAESSKPPHRDVEWNQESKAEESEEDECASPKSGLPETSEEVSLPPEEEVSTSPAPTCTEPEPRVQQFDRLVRQSKLWCYARGFRTDLRELHPRLTRKASKSPGIRGPGRRKGRGGFKKKKKQVGRATKFQSKKSTNPQQGVRPPFSFLGNFPAPPSLVVGEDGDLCPAYTLKTEDPKSVPRTHPIWGWHPGGSAIPLPPSLKFRTFPIAQM
ncbi:elongin BC and Polycomb repressive complex 2-associated protein [Hyperolius riggenbachi]|uniref:elongin BC and Polycomb repressive complex 2-associated protein n=1 Tax=Hyperolius riggenbachi TaxID=752182 RepID=UPI0035A3A7FB